MPGSSFVHPKSQRQTIDWIVMATFNASDTFRLETLTFLSHSMPDMTLQDAFSLTENLLRKAEQFSKNQSDHDDSWLNNTVFRQLYLENKKIGAIKMYRAEYPTLSLLGAKTSVERLWEIYDQHSPRLAALDYSDEEVPF